MTLTEFLEARISYDEENPECGGEGEYDSCDAWSEQHLAESAAKRAIIAAAFELASTIDSEWGCCHEGDAIRTGIVEPGFDDDAAGPLPDYCLGPDVAGRFLRPLAYVYAGHPDYRPEWRP